MSKKVELKEAQDFLEITDLLKTISPITLKTRNVLEELSKDEVLYTFFLVCTKYNNELELNLGKGSLPTKAEELAIEDFKKSVKKMPSATKKITKESAINDLLEIPNIPKEISLADISSFNFASDPLTFALFNIIRNKLGIINQNDTKKIESYIKKVLTSSKNPSISLLELFVLIEASLCSYNENDFGNIIGISKPVEEVTYASSKALKNSILVPLLGVIIITLDNIRINEINNVCKVAIKVEEKAEKIKDFEKEINLLKEENKNLKKTQLSESAVKKFNADMNITVRETIAENMKALGSLEAFKTDILSAVSKNVNNASAKAYENQINTLTTKVADLRANVVVKDNKIKDLEKKIEDLENSTAKIEKAVNKTSPEVVEEIAIENEKEEFIKSLDEIDVNNNPRVRLGYADIDDGIMVVKFLDKFTPTQAKLVTTEKCCPSLHQFMLVEESYKYRGEFIIVDILNFMHNTKTNLKACIVDKVLNNRTFVVEYSGEKITCTLGQFTHFNRQINVGNIIYCDLQTRNALIIPKTSGLWAEKFVDTVKAFGNKLVFIESLIGTTAFLKEIESGEQFIEELEFNNHQVEEHYSAIINNEGKVLTLFVNPRFYTGSIYYSAEKIRIVTIVTVGSGKIIAKDVNENKLFEVSNIPLNIPLNVGDVIKVDEWNGYIMRMDHEMDIASKNTVKKTVLKSQNNTNAKALDLVGMLKPNKAKVAVIGNVSYANSYATALAKEGYELIMVSGHDGIPAAKRLIKDADIVACCTGWCSHEMAWYAKDLTDKKVLMLPKSTDGATRITQLIVEKGW